MKMVVSVYPEFSMSYLTFYQVGPWSDHEYFCDLIRGSWSGNTVIFGIVSYNYGLISHMYLEFSYAGSPSIKRASRHIPAICCEHTQHHGTNVEDGGYDWEMDLSYVASLWNLCLRKKKQYWNVPSQKHV